ncbi:MAG: GDSL-type esterase/lipase family protein [Planctomycetota bacterium]|nr:GDSL-type esterase/lipase family protein [Planctomycetota bacterium]
MKTPALLAVCMLISTPVVFSSDGFAQDISDPPDTVSWAYDANVLQPFWRGDTVHGESSLFIKDPATGEANAQLLFPVEEIISVCRAVDWMTPNGTAFENGRDYVFTPGSREITLPEESRIPSFTADQLRRPVGSQKYKLTHRDGNGEILFGATDEYHQMQVCITYRHTVEKWPSPMPAFDKNALPMTIQKLQNKDAVSIVLLGDSISTGCNASGWANAAPHQPPFQDLLLQHLKESYSPNVTLTNLAVGGTSTPWGLTRVPDVVAAKPDLVILAFGMNDSSGRSSEEYKANTQAMIDAIRDTSPQTEFILVATMLGNRDWLTLKQELFPQYRTALKELTGPGIALADMTSIWTEMLNRKQDRDLTGNGVNHPNDFGHRVYAQVLATLLVPPNGADATDSLPSEPFALKLWPDKAPNGDNTFEASNAKVTVHLPKNPAGSAIIICPGGGYGGLVTGAEGHGIGEWLNSHGITGVVLEYRLPAGRSFVPLLDAQRAIRMVRANSKAWQIDPTQIGIMGFSAGGHLASTAATHFDAGNPDAVDPLERPSCRPDFAVLVYPVVTMGEHAHGGSRTNLLGGNPSQELVELFSSEKQVTEKTPPMFLAHAIDDGPVPSINSKIIFDALQSRKIPSKYLELPSGGHGLNGYKGPMWDAWQKQSLEWLAEQKLITAREEQE